MKMRRPAAIFRGRPDVREFLASRNALTGADRSLLYPPTLASTAEAASLLDWWIIG